MTKKNLADLVKLRLGILGADTRLDERTVWQLADRVRRKLILDYSLKLGNDSRGEFIKPMVQAVKMDSITGLKYVQYDIVNLPDGKGIVSVGKKQDLENLFIQQAVGQVGVYSGLEAAEVGTTYWQEGSRLYFNNLGSEVDEVLVRGIPSIVSLKDDEEIPMPASIEDDTIEEVVKKIMNQVPTDKSSDQRNSAE